jgi:hypothetical protein
MKKHVTIARVTNKGIITRLAGIALGGVGEFLLPLDWVGLQLDADHKTAGLHIRCAAPDTKSKGWKKHR